MKTQITIGFGFCLVALTLFVCLWHRETRVVVVSASAPEVYAAAEERMLPPTSVLAEQPAPVVEARIPVRRTDSSRLQKTDAGINVRSEPAAEQRDDGKAAAFTPIGQAAQPDQGSGITIGKLKIRVFGSDTMVNLAAAWAEAYSKVEPNVAIEVGGGGSGIGVAALINGTCDIANCSRRWESQEIQKAKAKDGVEPKEFMVGYDALSIYVHPSNPIAEISTEQVAQIYREGGRIDKWSQLGVSIPKNRDTIIRIGRQNNSGAYHYFRERIVGRMNDFKLGSKEMNGSTDVIEAVARTPNAIGYGGIGFATASVKPLRISEGEGRRSIEPSIENTQNQMYPLGHPLFLYTLGRTAPHVQRYLLWALSTEGQEIAEKAGYVRLAQQQTAALR